jgi:hypothetical protein
MEMPFMIVLAVPVAVHLRLASGPRFRASRLGPLPPRLFGVSQTIGPALALLWAQMTLMPLPTDKHQIGHYARYHQHHNANQHQQAFALLPALPLHLPTRA